MRPIDADRLLKMMSHWKPYMDMDNVRDAINKMPTLTQPNETPPCYQPDGDGCAYQCYDGDDEPIDKCKECPLCYSDKQRHHAPPNEALTLEQLREMVGEPVYDYLGQEWYVIQEYYDHELTMTDGTRFFDDDEIDEVDKRFYRRLPEGEA